MRGKRCPRRRNRKTSDGIEPSPTDHIDGRSAASWSTTRGPCEQLRAVVQCPPSRQGAAGYSMRGALRAGSAVEGVVRFFRQPVVHLCCDFHAAGVHSRQHAADDGWGGQLLEVGLRGYSLDRLLQGLE